MLNEYLTELIGKSYNAKTMFIADKYMKEQIESFYGGHIPSLKESATIVAHTNGEIKGIGASCVDDLILDNFGKIIAGIIRTPVSAVTSIFISNDVNTSRQFDLYHTLANAWNTHATQTSGTKFRLGSGSTPPARTDFKIETALGTAPENTYFNTGNGGWNSALGKVTAVASIVSGGSGTIRESGLFLRGVQNSTGVSEDFMIAHDAISPNVSYVVAQNLTCQYVYTM